MSARVHFSRSQSTAGSAGTTYYNPHTLKSVVGEANAQSPWPVSCNITSFRVNISTAQGAASRVFTIRKAGSDQAHTLTFTGSTVTATIQTSVAWTAGDLISIKEVITGSPAALGSTGLEVILEYNTTTAGQAGYTWGTHTCNVGSSMRNPLFSPRDVFVADGTRPESAVQNICASDGDITGWWVIIPADSADGAGTITCYIVRNGVRQDGTGGTVNTAIQFSNATTWANPLSASFTLPKDRLDTFSMEIVHAGATTFAAAVAVGIQVTNDTAAEAEIFFFDDGNVPNSATAYSNGPSPLWNAVEASTTIAVGPSSFSLKEPVYKMLSAAPGSSKDYTWTQRKNAGDPSGTTSVTITGAAQTGEDNSANFVTYNAGDTFTTKEVPTGTPTASTASWAYVMTVLAAEIKGSFVAGADGTVTSSHTALFNLDDVTRTVHAPNTLYVAGYFTLHEGGSPSPIANAAILFAKDTGGKTELLVQFPTGSAIQIAIEA